MLNTCLFLINYITNFTVIFTDLLELCQKKQLECYNHMTRSFNIIYKLIKVFLIFINFFYLVNAITFRFIFIVRFIFNFRSTLNIIMLVLRFLNINTLYILELIAYINYLYDTVF